MFFRTWRNADGRKTNKNTLKFSHLPSSYKLKQVKQTISSSFNLAKRQVFLDSREGRRGVWAHAEGHGPASAPPAVRGAASARAGSFRSFRKRLPNTSTCKVLGCTEQRSTKQTPVLRSPRFQCIRQDREPRRS